MNSSPKICPVHKCQKFRKSNSTIFICLECAKEQTIAMNKRSRKNKSVKKPKLSKARKSPGVKSVKAINKELDTLWSYLVKLRAGHTCEYCRTDRTLNSHHIYGRRKYSVRWDPINGISLCAKHHKLSSDFSAHETPMLFTKWITKYRGQKEMDILERRANTISHYSIPEKLLMIEDLKRQIKELEEK